MTLLKHKTKTFFSEAHLTRMLNNPRLLWLIALMMQLLYLFPILYFGEYTNVVIYDNLDIVVPINKMLADSGMMFASSDAIVPNIMGGLPRFLFGSDLNVYSWLYLVFDPFTAFAINEVLMHVVGLMSMIILLKRYFIPNELPNHQLIIFSTAILYSMLPFYTGAGLSVSLLPLALFAFMNIRNGDTRVYNWLIIALIPFYSSLILVYFFFLLLMATWFIVDVIKERHINIHTFFALLLMSSLFLVVEHHLVYATFLSSDFVSHRVEFDYSQTKTLWEVYISAHQVFLNGLQNIDWRASGNIFPFVIFMILLSFYDRKLSLRASLVVIILFTIAMKFPFGLQYITGNKFTMPALFLLSTVSFIFKPQWRLFYGLILILIFFSYLYGFWFYEGINSLAEYFPFIKQFNFARIAFLLPLLWFLLLALGLVFATKLLRYSIVLIVVLFLYQSSLAMNTKKFSSPRSPLSFKSYFAEDLFHQIDEYIGRPKETYRVASLIIHPAQSIYNGFYTIDGYLPNYPLEYKKKFFKIIEDSLIDNAQYEQGLFEKWGSKCYLFDGGLLPLHYERRNKIDRLLLNFDAFYALGGRYLISPNEINASVLVKHPQLTFLKRFDSNESFWQIYLYEVNSLKAETDTF